MLWSRNTLWLEDELCDFVRLLGTFFETEQRLTSKGEGCLDDSTWVAVACRWIFFTSSLQGFPLETARSVRGISSAKSCREGATWHRNAESQPSCLCKVYLGCLNRKTPLRHILKLYIPLERLERYQAFHHFLRRIFFSPMISPQNIFTVPDWFALRSHRYPKAKKKSCHLEGWCFLACPFPIGLPPRHPAESSKAETDCS